MENMDYLTSILEGLLFIAGDDGLTKERLLYVLEIEEEVFDDIFSSLQKYYLSDSRGIELVNYGNIYKFLSKASVHQYAQKLFADSSRAGFSQSALETLAIIAYKQPITRIEIEEIRGVGCDMMIRKLLARDLIREVGRSESAGRPILYEVTEEFLDTFKLMSLDELPELPTFNRDDENEKLFD